MDHEERQMFARLERKVDLLLDAAGIIIQGEAIMAQDISALEAKVKQNTDVVESAKTLINGLAQQIKDAGVDPTKLQALVDQLDASDTSLAQAVAANTPVAPTPAPSPAPVVDPNAPTDPNAPQAKRR